MRKSKVQKGLGQDSPTGGSAAGPGLLAIKLNCLSGRKTGANLSGQNYEFSDRLDEEERMRVKFKGETSVLATELRRVVTKTHHLYFKGSKMYLFHKEKACTPGVRASRGRYGPAESG